MEALWGRGGEDNLGKGPPSCAGGVERGKKGRQELPWEGMW